MGTAKLTATEPMPFFVRPPVSCGTEGPSESESVGNARFGDFRKKDTKSGIGFFADQSSSCSLLGTFSSQAAVPVKGGQQIHIVLHVEKVSRGCVRPERLEKT